MAKKDAYKESIEKDYAALTAGQPASIPDVVYPNTSTPFVAAKAGQTAADVKTTDTMPIVSGGTERHNVTNPPDYVPKVEGIEPIPQQPEPVADGKPEPATIAEKKIPTSKGPAQGPVINEKEIDTPLGSTYTKPWKPADMRFDGNILRRILQTLESGARGYTGDKTETDRQRELREIASFKEISDRASAEAKARAEEYAQQDKARQETFKNERQLQASEIAGRKAIEDAQRRAAAGASAGTGMTMNPKPIFRPLGGQQVDTGALMAD